MKKYSTKRIRAKVFTHTLLITYTIYILSSILFVLDPEVLNKHLLLFFTFYPFLFPFYIHMLKKKISKLSIHVIIKHTLYALLLIITVIIVYGQSEAINRHDYQVMRGFVSIYISLLMFIVIFLDIFVIGQINKLIKLKNRRNNTRSKSTRKNKSRQLLQKSKR